MEPLARNPKNSNFKSAPFRTQNFIPFIDFIQPKTTVSIQICLDSREISVSKQIWLKIQSSPFFKRFIGFINILEWILIQLLKFPSAPFRTKFQGKVVYD